MKFYCKLGLYLYCSCFICIFLYLTYTEKVDIIPLKRGENTDGEIRPKIKTSQVTKVVHETWERVQEKRRQLLQKSCDSIFGFNPSNATKMSKGEFILITERLVVERKKMTYCPISKNGNTNLKHFLAIDTMGEEFERVNNSVWIHHPAILKKNDITNFGLYSESHIHDIIREFKNIIFVREPLERLISAFRDKFENLAREEAVAYCEQYGRSIIRRYRRNPSEESLKTGQDVTFEEFVKFVIDDISQNTYLRLVDRHWLPQWAACDVCQIRYDVIGKMDTFNDDITHIFSQSAIKTLTNITSGFTERASNRSSTPLFEKYYSKISLLDKQRLFDVYKRDYLLFGYKPPFDFLQY